MTNILERLHYEFVRESVQHILKLKQTLKTSKLWKCEMLIANGVLNMSAEFLASFSANATFERDSYK